MKVRMRCYGAITVFLAASCTAQNTLPANGNVGVGTTNPQATFNVSGTSRVDAVTVSYNEGLGLNCPTDMYGGGYCGYSFFNAPRGGAFSQSNVRWSQFFNYTPENGVTGGGFSIIQNNANTRFYIAASGNVGINTTNPGSKLEVNGDVRLSSGSGGKLYFPDNSFLSTANGLGAAQVSASLPDITDVNGSVGIRNTSPVGAFDVGGVGGLIVSGSNLGSPTPQPTLTALQSTGRLLIGWNASGWGREVDLVSGAGGGLSGFRFYDYTSDSRMNLLMAMPGNGNIGIGTASPGSKLEVNGNVALTAGSGATMTFQDGSIQTVAWNGTIGGQDYADSVQVAGNEKDYEPGDVLVIDSEVDRTFHKVAQPYSHLVAGIYSTKPGLVGHLHLPGDGKTANEVPLAMAGLVPAKVSTENGPIRRGDLLVASSTPGYAMKGTDPALLTGAVIGKALGTLASGKGIIEVLVALQ